MNNKMGGDMKKIQATGRYFVEIWKAIGMEGIGDKARPVLAVCPAAMATPRMAPARPRL